MKKPTFLKTSQISRKGFLNVSNVLRWRDIAKESWNCFYIYCIYTSSWSENDMNVSKEEDTDFFWGGEVLQKTTSKCRFIAKCLVAPFSSKFMHYKPLDGNTYESQVYFVEILL